MGVTAVVGATVLYVMAAVACFRQKDYSHGIMWSGYSLANIGLLAWEIKKLRESDQ